MSYSHDNTTSPINFPRKDTSYKIDTNRPSGTPKSNKDFKKVLQKPAHDDDDDEPIDNVSEAVGEEEGGKLAATGSLKRNPRPRYLISAATKQAKKAFLHPRRQNQHHLISVHKQMVSSKTSSAPTMTQVMAQTVKT